MSYVRPAPLTCEALFAAAAAAALAAVLLWAGPPGNDLAAHVYQRTLFLEHGFVLWNNFWYAGRYSFVTYSLLYYPVSAVVGIKLLALVSVAVAAFAFAVVIGREWGRPARWSSRAFAFLWAGTVLSAAFPFALGAAFALLALWALQDKRRLLFGVLALLTLAASALAFVFLSVVLLGFAVAQHPARTSLLAPAAILVSGAFVELALLRLFPDGGRFPYRLNQLIPTIGFCALGALMAWGPRRARPLLGFFLVYLAACVLLFLVPTELGSNIERLRYAAIPLALLAVSVAGWRPLWVALPLLVVAGYWNVEPLIANYRHAAEDPASTPSYWQPAVQYFHRHLQPSFRVEAVDTLEHWPAVYLPEKGVPIVRGWYRQNDFPGNALLYDDELGPARYRRWLRAHGVRYVLLSDAPPDYSSRAEVLLLRSAASGLVPVYRTAHLTVYALPHATPLVTGSAAAEVRALSATRLLIHVGPPRVGP
jgi:hypothetical protein